MRKFASLALGALALSAAGPANAGLVLFQSYVGQYGLSTDGGGSIGGDYLVSASVPFGAMVTGAYLYQSTSGLGTTAPVTMNGTPITFGAPMVNGTDCCQLTSARADVTSLVSSVINGGAGGVYDFTIGEGNTGNTDGTALVVVYSLSSLAESTVAILDGSAAVTGDTTFINFADPLDPTDPGFVADMRLGIGFSCCSSQHSTVNVNGALMTEFAGNHDDGPGSDANGRLITVGSFDDPFSPALPNYDTDTERYDLTPFISSGDTQIKLDTFNTSRDDNIFLLAGIFSGIAGVNEPPPTGAVPEPATWLMFILGFMAVGGTMRMQKRREKVTVRYA